VGGEESKKKEKNEQVVARWCEHLSKILRRKLEFYDNELDIFIPKFPLKSHL